MVMTDLMQTTFLLTLLQLFLGQDSWGCLASSFNSSSHHHHHHHHHHRPHRRFRDHSGLLESSLKFYDPSGDHQKEVGKGENYQLVFQSMGDTFFDEWNFFTDADPTHGMVSYQGSEASWQNQLVLLQQSSLDKSFTSAIMKVDDYTFLPEGQNRNSVRLVSKQSFKYGLVILDVIKVPFGCSTWPAFWTVGENWPNGGEIDIVEGVNVGSVNQMTVHSVAGCKLKKTMSQNASGKVLHTDCDGLKQGNLGCGVADPSIASFGKAFNDNGGGVFVMEWKQSGISVWRFSRCEIPEELLEGKNPSPSSWTIPPIAHWDNDDCRNLSEQFSSHRIIFDTTLCGDWAGAADVYNANQSCSGSCSSAVMNASNYKDAFWEVSSVKLYQ